MPDLKDSIMGDQSKGLFLGLDVGSVSLDSVVLDGEGKLLWADYTRTMGRPLAVSLEVLQRILQKFPRQDFRACAVTGSGAGTLAPLLNAQPVNEIICLTKGVGASHPEVRAIIDMGGEDAKLILVSPGGDGGLKIDDFAMNTMCAAGTGSFLDQQSHRLGLSIEEFSRIALDSQNPPRLAGRCSVFAKTDMIHLQQEATPDYDIVAGLCFAMARNLKSNIAKGKKVTPPVCFTGGVAANQGVHRALIEIMGLEPEQLIVPEHFGCMGAWGAALTAREMGEIRPLPSLDALEQRSGQTARETKRLGRLSLDQRHFEDLQKIDLPPGSLKGYLGVDVGSISTNVVVIDEQGRLLSKQYLMTAGRPLEAVKEGLRLAGNEIGDRLTILGAGTTGSGRYLTADFIGADIVRNEITAQATAAAFIDPEVDTIFEIGGQDSKFISLKDGAIVDFMMNKVCAAGTGSFLEEQAEKLGIQIKEEFGRRALGAQNPVRMGERCTVFMESDLVSHQAAGEEIDDLVAGLSYSIAYNYLNKVVEDRHVGQRIFYQGATAANKGIVAAFEAILEKPITVPPHNDVTGAIGAALLAMRERTWEKSSFKGFDISEIDYKISTFECQGCPNTCTIRKVEVQGEKRPLFYGSRCEKYDVDKSAQKKGQDLPDLFAEREEMLLSYLEPVAESKKRGEIGVPRSMFFREYMPFFNAFLQRLGYEPVVSGPTNKKLIHKGVEAVVNEPCFPMKVAHGHLAELVDAGVKRILMPSMVNMAAPNHPLEYGEACPYVQTLPYTAPAAIDFKGKGVELIHAPLHFGFGPRIMRDDLMELAGRLGARSRDLGSALEAGLEAQADFYRRLKERGRQVQEQMGPDDLAMVVVSRPYNGADPGINLGLPQKMRGLGVWSLPMDFLDLDRQMDREDLAEMYWRYGQRILAAAAMVRQDPRLYAVYITNFGCGPDSFIGHFFAQMMEGKPFLEIEIDEHSADVGAITRLEAFLDSLKNSPPRPLAQRPARRRNLQTKGRTVYIPPMTDHSIAVAAAFDACGGKAQVLPESDQRTLELGRRYTSGKECYPCALTTGDMLKLLLDSGVDPGQVAMFMPSGTGPCRFGQYHRFHRLVLDELGFEDVPIYAPDQSEKFYQELNMAGGSDFSRLGWQGLVAVDLLQKALHETRPYEAHRGDTDRVYQQYLHKVSATIRERRDLVEIMHEAKGAFQKVPRTNGQPRPLVGVVGEIYTRANRFANENVVSTIEQLGGEVWMPTIGEWVLYINFTSTRRAWMFRRYKAWLGTKINNYYQHKDEHTLGRPWRGFLHSLHEPPTRDILDMAYPYLHDTYEGEAILSLGKSRDMLHRGAAGVVNVIPFTCMPGTIVNALMKRFREDHGNMPFLAMSMDGQEQSGSRVRLEAFMHQVTQFQEQSRRKR
ncbi:MAG: acyl-CoA dehydratase activase [Desulfarculaceae bacterium]|jgi:predicted CoA-substrate-specific enzyme activase